MIQSIYDDIFLPAYAFLSPNQFDADLFILSKTTKIKNMGTHKVYVRREQFFSKIYVRGKETLE